MPKYPASWFPPFRMKEIKPGDMPEAQWKRRFTVLDLFVHNGTHVESSDHITRDGQTIDLIPLSNFAGYPTVLDFPGLPNAKPISESDIVRKVGGVSIAPESIILIRTGYNDREWGHEHFWKNSPFLTTGAARVLAGLAPALIGLDFQTEKYQECEFPVHRELLKGDTVLCEYLFNLKAIGPNSLFVAMPVNINGAEASCVRAVAIDGLGNSPNIPPKTTTI